MYILYYLLLFLLRSDHRKTRIRLKRTQTKRFMALLNHLMRSPFYRDIAKDGRLEAFPIISKEAFMANFDDINTLGIKRDDALKVALEAERTRDFSKLLNGVVVGLSTGTSGNKGIFLAGEKERAQWAAAIIQRVVGIPFRPKTVAFFLRANSKLYESANSRLLQFNFFDLMNDHNANFKRLNGLKADILVAQPSALMKIAGSYTQHKLIPGFKKVISVAEVLEENDRKYLQEVFGLRLDEVYQCTEGFLACSCKHGKLHFNEDFLIVEKDYIDQQRTRYRPIITDLYRKTQPIVRYRLDDILIHGGLCKCGSHFEVIERIEGRCDDIIRLPDASGNMTDIFPDFLSRAITISSEEITDYVLCQTGANTLEIYISPDSELIRKAVIESIKGLFLKFDIQQVEINFTGTGIKEPNVKLRRIRNEYHKKLQDSRHG